MKELIKSYITELVLKKLNKSTETKPEIKEEEIFKSFTLGSTLENVNGQVIMSNLKKGK